MEWPQPDRMPIRTKVAKPMDILVRIEIDPRIHRYNVTIDNAYTAAENYVMSNINYAAYNYLTVVFLLLYIYCIMYLSKKMNHSHTQKHEKPKK